jgi:hypothetical protein
MHPTLSPTQISEFTKRLLATINSRHNAVNVIFQPDPKARLKNCFINVGEKIEKQGGNVRYGWAIWFGLHLCEAEFHSVWESPDQLLIDITPRNQQFDKIFFVPIDGFVYTGQSIGNIRLNITNNSVVDDFICVANAIDVLYSYGKQTGEGVISMPQNLIPVVSSMEQLKLKYEPFLDAGGTILKDCFCGKKIAYQDCHGFGLQKDVRECLTKASIVLHK